MDADGLPMIGSGVKYNEVRAIHQKRTLAFINHFISNTVSFLNKFSRSCELRFEKFEAQIQKLEASLSILEAKLISISSLDNTAANQVAEIKKEEPKEIIDSHSREMDKDSYTGDEQNSKSEPEATDPQISVFLRMVKVGVPIQAVRLKMQAEGLDPNLLSNSGNAIPRSAPEEVSSDSDSSASSFSD